MSSAMEEDLSTLIDLACGPRTTVDFANSCGISRAHLFRLRNKNIKPSKRLLLKIANDSYAQQIGITLERLYRAGGYSDEEINQAISFENTLAKEDNDTIVDLGLVTRKLMEGAYEYRILPMSENHEVDFAFMVKRGRSRTKWNFMIASTKLVDVLSNKEVNSFYHNVGLLLMMQPQIGVQYTMIFHDEGAYNKIIENNILERINANVSIVLLDIKNKIIKKEIFSENLSKQKFAMNLISNL